MSASLVERDGDLEMIMPDREPSNEGDALTEVTMHFLSSLSGPPNSDRGAFPLLLLLLHFCFIFVAKPLQTRVVISP